MCEYLEEVIARLWQEKDIGRLKRQPASSQPLPATSDSLGMEKFPAPPNEACHQHLKSIFDSSMQAIEGTTPVQIESRSPKQCVAKTTGMHAAPAACLACLRYSRPNQDRKARDCNSVNGFLHSFTCSSWGWYCCFLVGHQHIRRIIAYDCNESSQ